MSPNLLNKTRGKRLSDATRYLTIAFGIVVVLGKGTRGAEPTPPPEGGDQPPTIENPVTPNNEVLPPTVPPENTMPTVTTTETAIQPSRKKEKSPWRGSEIAYRNSVTTLSFDKSADLTYNPFWGMALELSPRFWFDDMWSIAASLELQREITEADDTTRKDETLLGDLGLSVGASNFAKIPVLGINLSASLGFSFPTSLASQGDTLMFSLAPALRLSRSFDVLAGLNVGYGIRFTKYFHEYTTSELESPAIAGCFVGDSGSCDRLLNTGYRNTSFRLSNTFDVGLDITDWLSVSTSFGVVVSWLHDATEDERVSHTELEPVNERYAFVADLGVSARPWTPLEIRLGASTFNPQLEPDGDLRTPYFNRFTTLYLDLRLDVAALVQDLTEEN